MLHAQGFFLSFPSFFDSLRSPHPPPLHIRPKHPPHPTLRAPFISPIPYHTIPHRNTAPQHVAIYSAFIWLDSRRPYRSFQTSAGSGTRWLVAKPPRGAKCSPKARAVPVPERKLGGLSALFDWFAWYGSSSFTKSLQAMKRLAWRGMQR